MDGIDPHHEARSAECAAFPGLKVRLRAGGAAVTFLPAPVFPAHFWTIHALTEAPSAEPVLLDGAVGQVALRLVLHPQGSVLTLTHPCYLRALLAEPVKEVSVDLFHGVAGVAVEYGWVEVGDRLHRRKHFLCIDERGRRTGTLLSGGLTVSHYSLALPLGFGHELVSFLLSKTCIGLSLLQHLIRRDLRLGRVVVSLAADAVG